MVNNELSVAEARIYVRVVEGKSNKEIATEININEKTVKFHTTNIYKKCNVKSRANLIVQYWKNKLGVTQVNG